MIGYTLLPGQKNPHFSFKRMLEYGVGKKTNYGN